MRLLHNMYDVIPHPLSAARQGDEAIAQYVWVIPHPLSGPGKEMRLLDNMYDVIPHPLSVWWSS